MGDGERDGWRVEETSLGGREPHRLMWGDRWMANISDEMADALAALLSRPEPQPSGPPVFLLLDLWTAMGGEDALFHPWWASDPSFPDRWAQIAAAVAGNLSALAADTNPPAGALLDIAREFHARSARVVEPESEPVPSPAPVTDLPEGYVRLPSGAVVADVGAKCAVGWEFFTGDPIDVRWEPMDDAAGPVSSQFPIAVRPASPVTEPVPLHELKGRRLDSVVGAGPVVKIEQDRDGGWLAYLQWGGWPAPLTLDESGCVTVLAEDGK